MTVVLMRNRDNPVTFAQRSITAACTAGDCPDPGFAHYAQGVVDEHSWLSLPEVAEATDLPLRTVRGYLRDRILVATRRGENNALAVPADFLVPGEEAETLAVLPSLRGTITMLADSGYADEEIVDWLLRDNDELGETPMASLRAGRTHAVRRAAQSLAF